jgi:hypothetical protein
VGCEEIGISIAHFFMGDNRGCGGVGKREKYCYTIIRQDLLTAAEVDMKKRYIILIGAVLLIVYLIIWGFFQLEGFIPSGSGLKRADWLSFLGEFLGFVGTASLGFVAYMQNVRLHRENKKLQEDNIVLEFHPDMYVSGVELPWSVQLGSWRENCFPAVERQSLFPLIIEEYTVDTELPILMEIFILLSNKNEKAVPTLVQFEEVRLYTDIDLVDSFIIFKNRDLNFGTMYSFKGSAKELMLTQEKVDYSLCLELAFPREIESNDAQGHFDQLLDKLLKESFGLYLHMRTKNTQSIIEECALYAKLQFKNGSDKCQVLKQHKQLIAHKLDK